MSKDLCPACENYGICILRRNSENPITRCCIFCIHCKSYNWSCTNGPNLFFCYLNKRKGESFLAIEKHDCKRFKHE